MTSKKNPKAEWKSITPKKENEPTREEIVQILESNETWSNTFLTQFIKFNRKNNQNKIIIKFHHISAEKTIGISQQKIYIFEENN